MKQGRVHFLMGTYSAILLAITLVAIAFFIAKLSPRQNTIKETLIETEYIYVVKTPESSISEETTASALARIWIVREYEEKIGVFSENDELLLVIDTYTKTLPETDRRLLKEGILITSREALYSIIEDYSN